MNQHFDKARDAFLSVLSACVHHTPFNNPSLSFDEWRAVITLARAHNVLALVFEKASEDENFMALPEYQQLAFETMSTVAGQARRTEAFLSLYRELLKADVHPIVMKGLICRQLYGEYCDHRPSGDEDILIRKEEYEHIQHIFVESGYAPEIENVTAFQEDKLHEIAFHGIQTSLMVEVHTSPIGHEENWRQHLNDCFQNVFQNSREEKVDETPVAAMGHTDHMLFLIIHALKHLVVGGFGIRQVMDILLYVEKYGTECNWDEIKTVLRHLNAEEFFSDLLHIGNQYLDFHLVISSKANSPEDLLTEILDCGVFGNATQVQRTAAQMTNAAMRTKDDEGKKYHTLFETIFPSRAWMLGAHPELQEKPYLLPICWVKRWGRFLAHNKASGGNLAVESIKISKRRIELLKKYDIL